MSPLKKLAIVAGLIVAGIILVPVLVAPVAFDALFPPDAETAQLKEWSVLRNVEESHRDSPQLKAALIVRRALDSGYTAIGFPARGRARGYVWVLANPSTDPRVKQIPQDLDFVVSQTTLAWIQTQTALDPRVTAYLKAPNHADTHTVTAGQGQAQ